MIQHDDPLFDPRLAEWLEADPNRAPAQVLETVLAAVPSISQRRTLQLPWGPVRPRLIGGAAVALFAILLVAVGPTAQRLLDTSGIGQPTTPSPSTSPSASPSPSISPSPRLPSLSEEFVSANHQYSLSHPAGWTATAGVGVDEIDVFTGPEGRIEVKMIMIPSGTSQDEWLDSHYRELVAELGGTCPPGDPTQFDAVRVGPEFGALFDLSCADLWLAMTAVGARAYDIRFAIAGGAVVEDHEAFVRAVLAAMTLVEPPAG